jgi:AcrR family transcriptional regulator
LTGCSALPRKRSAAAAAGLSTGAVYSNFGSKEELFLTLYEERIATRARELRSVVGAAGGGARGTQPEVRAALPRAAQPGARRARRRHRRGTEQGLDIVYPIRDEAWGVRRFMLREPSGTVVNVLSHRSG